jgi:cytochrome P450
MEPGTTPAHVPEELVRDFTLEFRGPIDEVFPRLDALREQGRALWLQGGTGYGARGAWLFTQAEDIRVVLQRPELFTSSWLNSGGLPAMIPIFMDPPEHTRYRRLLNPLFAPGVVAAMERSIRTRIERLVDNLVERGSCDFVADVAIQFPTRVFTSWIGLPEDDTDTFVGLVRALVHGDEGREGRNNAMGQVISVLGELIAERTAQPTDDLMSDIIRLDLDDRPLTSEELFRIAFLLFLAGLDTVAAALSFSFWHLAETPADRRAIATGAIPTDQAVEEMLRRHSFVNLPRAAACDMAFAGVQVKKGDFVVVSLPMASRDPAEHANPTDVDLARENNRHYAFGLGPHRCIGSHLARLEMRLALDAWHARIPDYWLDGEVAAYAGAVMGVSSLPLRWAEP